MISLLCPQALLAATLTADVDRKELLSNEHVIFTLSLINSDTRLRAEGVSPNVDLTRLTNDFELGTPRVNNKFNINRNRGRSTSEIIVELFPKHTGEISIPSFSVDGLTTKPINIKVNGVPAGKIPEVFAMSGVSKKSIWVNEMVVVYLDLYHRVDLKSAKLGGILDSEPKQLALTKLSQWGRTEQKHGINYNVTRTAWAITPQLNQSLKLYLPDVWVETKEGTKIRLPFKEENVTVKPLPINVPPLTIVGEPRLTRVIGDDQLEIGRAIPWEITLHAPASPITLPIEFPNLVFPEGLKVYKDVAARRINDQTDDISSTATYKGYIIPLRAGEFSLPEINMPYFDPERGVMDVVTLKRQTLTILPVSASTNQASTTKNIQPSIAPTETSTTQNTTYIWQLISLIFIALWLVTLRLWWHTKTRQIEKWPAVTVRKKQQSSNQPLKTRLLEAFGTRTLEEGLNQWEHRYGIDTEVRETVRKVQKFYYKNGNSIDQAILQKSINKAVIKIKNTSKVTGSANPWSPNSFTSRWIHREKDRNEINRKNAS